LLPLLQYADEQGWSEVAFVAAAALELYEVVRPTGADLDLPGLLHRAGGVPAFEAIARGLAAVAASARGDTEAVLAGAGQAAALLDDEACEPLDRCTAYVVCAAAYNSLNLWELVDELFELAQDLAPRCPVPAQAAAVAVNRVLLWLERATSLLETGEQAAADHQLGRALEAVAQARAVSLPALWVRDVHACDTALRLLVAFSPGSPAGADTGRLLLAFAGFVGAWSGRVSAGSASGAVLTSSILSRLSVRLCRASQAVTLSWLYFSGQTTRFRACPSDAAAAWATIAWGTSRAPAGRRGPPAGRGRGGAGLSARRPSSLVRGQRPRPS